MAWYVYVYTLTKAVLLLPRLSIYLHILGGGVECRVTRKQVGEREHERRALPGGFRGYPGARGNQKPETRNQKPEARGYNITRTSLSSPARIPRGKKTRRNGDTVRDLPPGNHHYQSVRSDAMLVRGETGALRRRSLQLWQRGSVAARQPDRTAALSQQRPSLGPRPWALGPVSAFVLGFPALSCLVCIIELNCRFESWPPPPE